MGMLLLLAQARPTCKSSSSISTRVFATVPKRGEYQNSSTSKMATQSISACVVKRHARVRGLRWA